MLFTHIICILLELIIESEHGTYLQIYSIKTNNMIGQLIPSHKPLNQHLNDAKQVFQVLQVGTTLLITAILFIL